MFHDEEDGDGEPVRGLPEPLPEGERILWQGGPSPLALAIQAFHIRFVGAYFAVIAAIRVGSNAQAGANGAELLAIAANTAVAGLAAITLLTVLAWGMARAAVFTLTDKRLVMRYGLAIRKYVNLPFSALASADLRRHGGGSGDIALTLKGAPPTGYLRLWPFARPLKFSKPQPLLRALPEAEAVAKRLAAAVSAHAPAATSVSQAAPETDNRAKPPSNALPAT
ncbi:MAG: photosynthetic complex putative assembly protein PuhB [Pseudomonadota bacterium]